MLALIRPKNKSLLVNLSWRELTLRTNDSPDDTGSAKHLRAQAKEAVFLCRGTHLVNVSKHPSLYAELSGACQHGGKNLCPEHRSWRDLHVVTKLEVW